MAEAFNIDEDPLNRDWLHSRWSLPRYKTKAFFKEIADIQMTLAQFKQTAMYITAVENGVIVDDNWVPVKDRK